MSDDVIRTVQMPEFSDEQIAYLNERARLARQKRPGEQRYGGVFTGTRPRRSVPKG